jgi:hypothetical protein
MPLPEPKFINKIDLSIISGVKEPIINAILLILYFSFILGISKISKGKAI